MKDNLKILVIPRWYPGRVDPLNGIFIKRHAMAVAMKHQVAVLYVSADPEMKNKIYDFDYCVEDGIKTFRVYYNNSLPEIPFFSSAIKFYRYLQACRKGIKHINAQFGIPSISHIHVLSRTFFSAYYYKYFYKVPYVISEQWSGYHKEDGLYSGFFKKLLTRVAIKNASAVTTVSESLKDAMLSHGLKNDYTIIPNVVNMQLFFPSSEQKKREKLILLHVSNLNDRAKNVSGMIHVIKKLSEKRNDFEFHIVGDGPDRKNLENLAEKSGLLNSFIFFEGVKNSSEVADRMRNSDLFLLFSNYDNMPCVMVESFASGLPVIGSAIHGIKENVKEGMGLTVAPCNEKELLSAIENAIDNLYSFDKWKLHEYAKKNFSFEGASEKFDEIYQKII